MKRRETGVLLAGVLALGLTACSATRDHGMASSAMGGTGATSPMAGADSGEQSGSSTYGATSSAPPATGSSTAGATAATATPNSTVTSIEVVPRQPGGAAGTAGSAAVGSSSTTGTTGSSMTADRVYRITLRMDDGATQVVTQDWTPSFTTGDRVRIVSGAIQR